MIYCPFMKKTLLVIVYCVAGVCAATPWADYVQMTVRECVRKPQAHPRLLANVHDFRRVRGETNELFKIGRDRVIFEADQMRRFPLPLHKLEGRRMLTVSQRSVARISTLAMAYHLTSDKRYAARAIAEAEAACKFKDWNPSHFLDTAEMTLAVAIAYDWLFDVMTPNQRTGLRKGLLKNGLREKNGAPKTGGWVKASNNWGQVCHAGICAGAIALMEDEPELAEKILVRAITELPRPMKAFAPAGGFPEGPGIYWGYAMTFNALAIDAIERVCGTDFGLCDLSGLKESADYLNAMTGPTGLKFNHSDAGISQHQEVLAKRETEACSWWLAKRFDRADTLIDFEIPRYRAYCADRTPLNPTPRRSFKRLFPMTLLWMQIPGEEVRETRAPLCRLIEGEVPIVVQRSGRLWSDWFVGIKGGSPCAAHGHMDGGSFVLDAKGCRWAYDIGSEDYHRMESADKNLWKMGQTSDRWKIFRLGAASHNILRINGGNQYVAGSANVESFTNGAVCKAVFNLTSLYPGVTSAKRTGTLLPGGGYVFDDCITGLSPGALVTWQMLTPARVKNIEKNCIVLEQKDPEGDDAEMRITISDKRAMWEVRDVSSAQGVDESPNPGLTMLSFTQMASGDGVVDFAVRFE